MSASSNAQQALFTAIQEVVAVGVPALENTPGAQAELLRDLALAYRYAAGGLQPGTLEV